MFAPSQVFLRIEGADACAVLTRGSSAIMTTYRPLSLSLLPANTWPELGCRPPFSSEPKQAVLSWTPGFLMTWFPAGGASEQRWAAGWRHLGGGSRGALPRRL